VPVANLSIAFAWNTAGRSRFGAGIDCSARFNTDGMPSSNLTYLGVSTADSGGDPLGNSF